MDHFSSELGAPVAFFGAIEIKIAIRPKELSNDVELQKTLMKHFIHRYWKEMKMNSSINKIAYHANWI